jgi:hypothetical protein
VAYCQTSKWVWDASPCPIAKLPTSKLRSTYAGKRVLFVGDSEIRNVYHSLWPSLTLPTRYGARCRHSCVLRCVVHVCNAQCAMCNVQCGSALYKISLH